MTWAAGTLYVVGGLLELFGILFVVPDLLVALKRAEASRVFRQTAYRGSTFAGLQLNYTARAAVSVEERLDKLEENIEAIIDQTDRANRYAIETQEQVYALGPVIDARMLGNAKLRWLGLGCLLAGVIISTVGNVLSLWA